MISKFKENMMREWMEEDILASQILDVAISGVEISMSEIEVRSVC